MQLLISLRLSFGPHLEAGAVLAAAVFSCLGAYVLIKEHDTGGLTLLSCMPAPCMHASVDLPLLLPPLRPALRGALSPMRAQMTKVHADAFLAAAVQQLSRSAAWLAACSVSAHAVRSCM